MYSYRIVEARIAFLMPVIETSNTIWNLNITSCNLAVLDDHWNKIQQLLSK